MGLFNNLFGNIISRSRSHCSDHKRRSHQGSNYYKRTSHSRKSLLSNLFSSKSYSRSSRSHKRKCKDRSQSWWS